MLDNKLAEKLIIRVPLIPEYNTEQDVENSIAELKALGITKFDRLTYRTSERKTNSSATQHTGYNYGKAVCEVLKQIRIEIAATNTFPTHLICVNINNVQRELVLYVKKNYLK